MGAPTVPMMGDSTVALTSRGSPSVAVLPPDKGVVLADVGSVRSGRSTSEARVSGHTGADSPGSRMDVSEDDSVSPAGTPFATTALQIDEACALHPFFLHKLAAGPVRLMTIAHAFNYRMAVLRDGVKSAVRVGRSRKAEGRFLTDTDIPWGQQVAVMFQIVSTIYGLELPSFLEALEDLRGVSPNVHLDCEPWGHMDHNDKHCCCRSLDRTAAYVNELAIDIRESFDPPVMGEASSCSTGTNGHSCIEPSLRGERPGLVSFVSDRPGAYGRLLLTVYVRWRTGLLLPSDWLRPVTRGGWRTGFPDRVRGSADVS